MSPVIEGHAETARVVGGFPGRVLSEIAAQVAQDLSRRREGLMCLVIAGIYVGDFHATTKRVMGAGKGAGGGQLRIAVTEMPTGFRTDGRKLTLRIGDARWPAECQGFHGGCGCETPERNLNGYLSLDILPHAAAACIFLVGGLPRDIGWRHDCLFDLESGWRGGGSKI
jgi:hypothetical protein